MVQDLTVQGNSALFILSWKCTEMHRMVIAFLPPFKWWDLLNTESKVLGGTQHANTKI